MLCVCYRNGDRLVRKDVKFAQYEEATQLWVFESEAGEYFTVRAENMMKIKLH